MSERNKRSEFDRNSHEGCNELAFRKRAVQRSIPTYPVLWVVFGLLVTSAQPQSINQAIQGLVIDGSESVVPGARITATNRKTEVSRSTKTNGTGNYGFPLVEVGDYDVSVSLEGFKTEMVAGIRVETGAQVRQDFQLKLGEVSEAIEVSASAVLLNTENAVVSSLVDNRRVTELPLNGRNIVQLAVLAPGVQYGQGTGRADGLGGRSSIPGANFSVSGNGIRELHQVVSLDGVDAKEPGQHITPFVPSIDAIEEFKVQTNTFHAQVGFGGGAVVNITMKSGTNRLHGSVFEFLRNDTLNAENYFLNFELPPGADQRSEDTRRRNQFGAFFSGPLVRNKTFWAAGWEARREIETEPGFEWYPIESFREGDYSELLTGMVNPETGRLFNQPIVIYDPFTGDPFPGNIIPKSRQHPGIINNILPQFVPPASFQQIDPLDFTESRGLPRPINQDQVYARIDHHFSDADRVFGRIVRDQSERDLEDTNPNFGDFIDSNTNNVATQWVHTFGARMVNELRAGFQTSDQELLHPRSNDGSFDLDALGIGPIRAVADGNRRLTPREHGLPRMFVYGLNDASWVDLSDTVQVANHVSMIRGHHNLKMGYEFYRVSMERAGADFQAGVISSSGGETGLHHASFLMGLPSATSTPTGWRSQLPRAIRQGAYIHDDWKVSPKLTVNLGLRFDYNGNPRELNGEWRTLDFPGGGRGLDDFVDPDAGQFIPTLGPPFVDERGAVKLWKQDVRFFMPRVGIAFRPTTSWVFRAGAGWFDNLMHQNNFTPLSQNSPKSTSFLFSSVTGTAQTIPITAVDGNTYNVRTRQYRDDAPAITLNDPFFINTGGQAIERPANAVHVSPQYKDGDVWKWSFDIQRALRAETALTIGYVGSKSTHVANSFRNWNSPLPSADNNVQANRPFPAVYDTAAPERGIQPLATIRYLDSYGNAFHHGLQVKLSKRYAKAFAYGLSYTFSRSHGDGEAGGDQNAFFQNPRFDRSDRGRFRFDQRHNLVAHFVWEMPGRSLPGIWKHVLGGWQSNGIVSLRSGFPLNVAGRASDLNVDNGTRVRPDLVGNPRLDNPTRKLWYNPQAFQRVTCDIPERQDLCHFGNFGYSVLDSPGQENIDLGFFKNVPINERFRLQIRSEFFNALNTPYFGGPRNISFNSRDSLIPDGSRDGEIRNIRTPMRIIQFGLKLLF